VVKRAGFALYLLAPAFFVDTTDIWLAPPRARIVSAFAGVFSGFVLGGLASLGLALGELGTLAAGLLYEVAFLGYVASAANLLPLLELDGYYILVDLLDLPRLRERSFAFLTRGLPRRLARRGPWTAEERILAAYGLLAIPITALAIGLALLTWREWLASLLGAVPGRG
jgi:putative peptide zinc metalloprotease protein